jgi:hypothetical protein
MNRICPLCGENLSHKRVKKVPIKGELSWLALRWHLQCPSCSGALQENLHPFEKAVFPTLMLMVALLNFFAYLFGLKASLLAVVASIGLIVIGPFIGRAIAVPRNWNRYALYPQAKR